MVNQKISTTPITDVMNAKVVTLRAIDTMTKVKEIFDQQAFHHIPIINDQNMVVGMISRMDYNRILSCHMIFNKKRNETYNENLLESLLVDDVMNKNVVSIKITDGLIKAANIFKENQFHALPVLDETNKLAGLVTTYDLLIFAYN